MNYRRISDEDRVRIEALYDAGLSRADIARQLGFHRSNIGRELNRVSGREYSSKKAKKDATEKQKCRSQPRKLVGSLIQKIKQLLSKRWSPLQIAKRIFLEQKVKRQKNHPSYSGIFQNSPRFPKLLQVFPMKQ